MKQLSVAAHQAKSQFITEIATISAVQHRNLVKLYGYSIKETRRLLVYEYLENKSLDHVLFGREIVKLSFAPFNFLYVRGELASNHKLSDQLGKHCLQGNVVRFLIGRPASVYAWEQQEG